MDRFPIVKDTLVAMMYFIQIRVMQVPESHKILVLVKLSHKARQLFLKMKELFSKTKKVAQRVTQIINKTTLTILYRTNNLVVRFSILKEKLMKHLFQTKVKNCCL